MPFNAVYGTAIYGDSSYGVFYVKGSANTTFNVTGSGSAKRIGNGSASLQFSSTPASIKGYGSQLGESVFAFEGTGQIRSSKVQIKGQTSFSFDPVAKIKGTFQIQGESSLDFSTNADIFGIANAEGSTELNFNSYLVILNRERIKAVETVLSFNTKSRITGESNLPWFPTLDELNLRLPYDNINTASYGQLFQETSSSSGLPYVITTEGNLT